MPEKERPADAVLLTYEDADGEPTIFAVTGSKRPNRRDVADAMESRFYRFSGWQETFSQSALPSGSTRVSAWAFDADAGKAFELDGTNVLE